MAHISLIQENHLSLKQHQQLLINLAMKQAFHVMQLPMLELSEWLKTEIENNPVLEIDAPQESYSFNPSRNRIQQEHQENLLTAPISLYEHLMQQATLCFENPQDLHLAELIAGHLNEKGFLETPLQEIAPSVSIATLERILQTVQTLDPPGVGAKNLQECLLLQLKQKDSKCDLAPKIIALHFEDLLHNRLPHIASQLHISMQTLTHIIQTQITPLDLNPGYRYCPQPAVAIIPDLHFLFLEDQWHIEINTSFLPRFHIAPIYVEALKETALENEESAYLRRQFAGGKWLERTVQKRNQTLFRIGAFLLKKQLPFFTGEKTGLTPLTMQEVATELNLNESTIGRAVANKYLACPQGLFPLRSFFNHGITAQNGQKISNRSLRSLLAQEIKREDKRNPLSDEQLAHHFHKLGIPCARRTIAKYRSALKISPASQRRRWDVSN